MTQTRHRQRVMMRIIKGGIQPADSFSQQTLKARGYKIGDIVAAEIKKPRNPGFHRLAHQIGALVAENIEAFNNADAHSVLKRIQIEANIACDEIVLNFPNIGPCTYRVPQSLSYESMDDGVFHETITAICKHISKQYWPTVSADEIERMAECWVEPIL